MKEEFIYKRICDVEGGDNTQTYKEFIRESEKEFGIVNKNIDMFTDDELGEYIKFLDYLWEK